MERLHPQTMQDLRQLVKLHGAERLIAAIRQIEKEPPVGRHGDRPQRRTP